MYAQRGDTREIHSSAVRLLIFNTTLELSSSSRFYCDSNMANSNFEAFFLDLFIEHKPWDCEVWFNIPIPIDLVCNRNPTLASQYMFTSIDITFTAKKGKKGGEEISKDQSSSWENKERSNHFCLTKNNNESRETKFKHVWVFFGKVIWIHLWIKPKARKRQEEEKMLSRCVFPFFPH